MAAPRATVPAAGANDAQVVVLDTNVWLDLFFFDDPAARGLARALNVGQCLYAVRCELTDAEIEAVLRRSRFAADPVRRAASLSRWRALARPAAIGDPAPWTCLDRNDQKFLDLAFAARAALLLSKDKALLALNRRTERDGLSILTPIQFGRRLHQDGTPQRECVVQRVMAP
jgi:uncharacterized protein